MSLDSVQFSRRSLLLGTLAVCGGCRSVPLTERKQILFSSEESEASLGLAAYQQVLKDQPASTNAHFVEMVERVGQRIAKNSGRTDYAWEFQTLAGSEQNAFCLPGGKVAVYEGMMPVCHTEAGLAVVMSHEIGHALARHGGERMSQTKVVDGGKQAIALVMRNQDSKRQEIVMQAYGLSSQYGVLLPYSRQHELEADHIGLMLMSKAGYDPAEAPQFWQRFGASHSGQKTLEYLSTHPSDDRRASELAARLPKAKTLYQAANDKIGHGAEIQIAQTDATPKALSAGKSPIQSAGFSVDRESSVDAHQAIPWSPSSRQTLR